MKKSDFYYDLPKEKIAQTPLKERSSSKLLGMDRVSGKLEDKTFSDIVGYLKEGDVLVRNNTRVIPARLYGLKEETGAHVEVLLLKNEEGDNWECLCGNARVIKQGTIISFNGGKLKAECLEVRDKGLRLMRMIYEGIFLEVLQECGNVPLPPYIHEKLEDKERYQTVYSEINGSAAAPTAGLHWTRELFDKCKEKGVEVLDITLHVGLGTFKPVDEENVEDHPMHKEYYIIDEYTAERLNKAKEEGRRIIAIGTTSVRTLEANYDNGFKAEAKETDIFIYPGYKFKAVDGIVTNFHLPESTLIMLVSAFSTRENILSAYKHAVDNDYRFFSFGDAMFIV